MMQEMKGLAVRLPHGNYHIVLSVYVASKITMVLTLILINETNRLCLCKKVGQSLSVGVLFCYTGILSL